nr:MAG TPA: SLA1 homology domain 1, SHD1 [Crassvirales sp.]
MPTSDENEGETIPQDNADKKQYTKPDVNQTDRSNKYIKARDINGNEVVGRFAGFSQGYVLIENADGNRILCPPNALEDAAYVDSFPEELTPKYNVGDKVLHNGKVYKVDKFTLGENGYTYWISGNNELINTGESNL